MRARSFPGQRPLACMAAFLGAGILLGLEWARPLYLLPLTGVLLSCVWLFIAFKKKHFAVPALCFLMLFLGCLRGSVFMHPKLPPEGKYFIEATCVGGTEANARTGGMRGYLKDLVMRDGSGHTFRVPCAYWTYTNGKGEEITYMDGQKLRFEGTAYHPSGRRNPCGFDFRAYLAGKGVFLGVSGARNPETVGEALSRHEDVWLRAKLAAAKRLDFIFGGGSALPKALLLGLREDVDETTYDAFRDTGTAHILAISGLHIGLMAAMLSMLLRRLHMGPGRRLAVTVALLLFYCRFLGFTASVVRASVMTAVMLGGYALRRRRDGLTVLSAAFIVIVIMHPGELKNVGFQLSFLAVLGLIVGGDGVRHLLERFERCPTWIKKLLTAYGMSFSAAVFTLPVTVGAFHRFAWAGLILSPIAIGAVGVLIPAYFVLLLLSFVPGIPVQALSLPVRAAADGYLAATRWAAGIAGARPAAAFSRQWMLFWFACPVLLSRFVVMTLKKRALAISILAAVCVMLSISTRDGRVRYTQFDVGAADAAVIEDGEHTCLVDTGERGLDVASYLLSRGRRVDAVLISHLHRDHAGGLEDLIAGGVLIDKVYLPQSALLFGADTHPVLAAARRAGIPIEYLSAGDTLQFGRTSCRVIWPQKDKTYQGTDENDCSMASLWDMDGVKLLTMGDITASYEQYAAARADLLKAGHHGGKNTSSDAFLDWVKPQAILISQGKTKRDRAKKTTERLKKRGLTYYAAYDVGAVTVLCGAGRFDIAPYLECEKGGSGL